jgi:hypothetical protein
MNLAILPSISQTKNLPSLSKQTVPFSFKSQLSLLKTFQGKKLTPNS